jgi:TetR/AcrR family transcriptional regulator, regulator of cefoperazone and chloramphenicol sensitivity
MDAAEACVRDLGITLATSGEVTRRSGVTFGVIQYHFGSYEALLLAVVERAAEGLRQTLQDVDLTNRSTRDQVSTISDAVWTYYSQPQYQSYIDICLNFRRNNATSKETLSTIQEIDADMEEMWNRLFSQVFGGAEDAISLQRLMFGAMRGLGISRLLNDSGLTFGRERQILEEMITAYVEQRVE